MEHYFLSKYYLVLAKHYFISSEYLFVLSSIVPNIQIWNKPSWLPNYSVLGLTLLTRGNLNLSNERNELKMYGILFYLLQAVHDLYELFHTRNNLFRRAYYHKVSKAVDYMYVYDYVNLGISINSSYRCQPINSPIRAQKKSLLKKKVPFIK
jgi:hypothetical protein